MVLYRDLDLEGDYGQRKMQSDTVQLCRFFDQPV